MFLDIVGPAKVTFELPRDCLNKYLKECIESNDWRSLELFLLGGGGHQSFAEGEGGIATGNCDLKDISLCDVLKADPKPNMYYELINALIDHGTLVNGCNEQDNPLVFALNHDDHDLAVFLLKKNANSENLLKSKFGKQDDTPIHTAFRIGLTLGTDTYYVSKYILHVSIIFIVQHLVICRNYVVYILSF